MKDLYGQIPMYRSMGDVIEEIAKERICIPGITLAGGSPKGWSRAKTFEACPQAYYRKYVKNEPMVTGDGLEVGSAVHAFLALHYVRGIVADSYKAAITADYLYDELRQRTDVNPQNVFEAWRVFSAYRAYYHENDPVKPLVVEYTVIDKATGQSARYDAVVKLADGAVIGVPGGTWIQEHKTAGAFDQNTVDGWDLDGEIVGQYTLWQRAKLDKVFGPLKGVIINLLGKQKTPQFTRTYVVPQPELAKRHLKVLQHIEGRIAQHKRERYWPQYMNSCIGRYGRCGYYDACRG